MKYLKESLGRSATFLLPSLKLKREWEEGKDSSTEQVVALFLRAHFAGFTVSSNTVLKVLRSEYGGVLYGEYRRYTIVFPTQTVLETLENFLSTVAYILDESSVYMETNEGAWLISARRKD